MRTDQLDDLSATTGLGLGHRFVTALATKDRQALVGLFGAEVDFQAMTPRRSWEERTGAAVVDDVILGKWFDHEDVIDLVESAGFGLVGSRHSLSYRVHVTNSDGRWLVEQCAYLDITDGKITWMRVLCSGYQPIESRD